MYGFYESWIGTIKVEVAEGRGGANVEKYLDTEHAGDKENELTKSISIFKGITNLKVIPARPRRKKKSNFQLDFVNRLYLALDRKL